MSEVRKLTGTIDADTAQSLHAGDQVLFTGTVYVARDAAHKRLIDLLDAGEELPFPVENSIVYYAGPAPAKPGQVIGPCGPTSSYRMDPYAPRLLDLGVRAMIGKGARSQDVIDAIVRNRCVYFAAVGGAAAYIAKSITSAQVIAYEDLGTEAIRKLEVVDMPLTVAIDCTGGNVYTQGPAAYLAATTG
ncbi:MAG: Fe-S-containing hydro-lyase [Coriobacteriales bacterium]